ncbi:hypothetical protein DL93DRAFT_2172246 [Clavulina sp. PMI_390]|nr:hypothetical protein DL93DRAFT_2172246 [Clavulina sp. PMI_390]
MQGSSTPPKKSTAVNRGSDDEKPVGAPIGSIFVELVSTPLKESAETFTIPIRSQLPDPSPSSSPASAVSSLSPSNRSLPTTSTSTQLSTFLRIMYSSPRIFTFLLLPPTPQHILLAAVHGDRIMAVSSEERFFIIFASFGDFTVQGESQALVLYVEVLRRAWVAGAKGENIVLIVAEPSSSIPLPHNRLACKVTSISSTR